MKSKYFVPVAGFFIAYYDLMNGKVDNAILSKSYINYQVGCLVAFTIYISLLIKNQTA
jgi:hypothetical protein